MALKSGEEAKKMQTLAESRAAETLAAQSEAERLMEELLECQSN